MKKFKLKRKKVKSLAKLKAEAWKLLSEWVRKFNADIDGLVKCVSCGGRKPWKEMQAGHFWPKSKGLQYWFCRINVHPQCVRCNMFDRELAKIEYSVYMLNVYGPKVIEHLRALPPEVFNRVKYLQLIQQLKDDLSCLSIKS